MTRVGLAAAVAVIAALSGASGDRAYAQSASDQQEALKRQIERRFDVLPLRSGLALRPRAQASGVRSIEVEGGMIAIDGAPATGAELRTRLGADADLVLRLSYLDADARQRMFGSSSAGVSPPPPPPLPPPPPAAPELPRPPRAEAEEPGDRQDRRAGGEDRVRFGGSVTVNEGERVNGDAVAIGGSVRVDGEITGNAVAIGGTLELGPKADVHGDAVSIGGGVKRDPGARVGGKVVDLASGNFEFGPWRGVRFRRLIPFFPFFGAAAGVFSLMSTVARVAVLCVLASLVLLVGREYVERIGARAAAEPVKAGAIGLLAQLLFVPLLIVTIVVLVVTIIGIPLLVLIPFALLALAVVALVGFTAVSYDLGRLVNRRFQWSEANPYLTVVTGILVILSPLLLARLLGLADWFLFPITGALVFLGFLLEYLAWTVGFGAVALLRFARPGDNPPTAGTV